MTVKQFKEQLNRIESELKVLSSQQVLMMQALAQIVPIVQQMNRPKTHKLQPHKRGSSLLSNETIVEILKLWQTLPEDLKNLNARQSLAKQYNVSESAIQKVVYRMTARVQAIVAANKL
jgi:hypothetical protein